MQMISHPLNSYYPNNWKSFPPSNTPGQQGPAEPCNLAGGVHSSSRPHLGFHVTPKKSVTQERPQGETSSNLLFERSQAWVVLYAHSLRARCVITVWVDKARLIWELAEGRGKIWEFPTLRCVVVGSLRDCSEKFRNGFQERGRGQRGADWWIICLRADVSTKNPLCSLHPKCPAPRVQVDPFSNELALSLESRNSYSLCSRRAGQI